MLRDLDTIASHIEKLELISAGPGILLEDDVIQLFKSLTREETVPFRAALQWYVSGMESVFLQDAFAASCFVPAGSSLSWLTSNSSSPR